MTEPTKITTPLEKGIPFILEMGTPYSMTLTNDERLTLTIKNPNEAKISCTVTEGAGEFWLYKNGKSLKNTYYLSSKPGFPTTVHLNTNTTLDEDSNGYIKVDKEEFDEESTKRSLALQYGVRRDDIEVKELKNEFKIAIPDSIWELYIAAGSYEDPNLNEHTFLVELLPPENDV